MLSIAFERRLELEDDLKAIHKLLLELEAGKGIKTLGKGLDEEGAKKVSELKIRMEVWLWQRA